MKYFKLVPSLILFALSSTVFSQSISPINEDIGSHTQPYRSGRSNYNPLDLSGPQKELSTHKEIVCKESWDESKCARIKARFAEIQDYRRTQRAKLNLLKSRHEELEIKKQKAKTMVEIQALEKEAHALMIERDNLKRENDLFNEKIKIEIKQERLMNKNNITPQ